MIIGPGSCRKGFLDYEVAASPWASFIWWKWGQDLAASYFAWKTNRKYERYLRHLRRRRTEKVSEFIKAGE